MKKAMYFLVMIGLVISLILAGCAKPASPPPPVPAPPPAPVPAPTPKVPLPSLTEAAMASEVDSLDVPTKTASLFKDDISTIYCTARLSNAPPNTEIRAEWIYVGGERSDLLNSILYENSVIESGTSRIKFSQNKRASGGWPLGKYEVVLYLNGERAKVVPFSIIEAPLPPEIKELLVFEMIIWHTEGYQDYFLKGKVKNGGNTELHDISFEISFYNPDGSLIETRRAALSPNDMRVGRIAYFTMDWQSPKALPSEDYKWRFISPTGEVIPFKWVDQQESAVPPQT